MKYSSLKIEDPLPSEDGILSDGPDSSCIYKSKYDVATYREKAPHLSYGEKVDLIKNVFVPEKKLLLAFQKQIDLLNMSGLWRALAENNTIPFIIIPSFEI